MMKRYDLHYKFNKSGYLASADMVEDNDGSLVTYEYAMQRISELERAVELLKRIKFHP